MKKGIILVVAGLLAGCGGGDTDSSGNVRAKDVMFTLNPQTGVSCPNADDASVFQSGDYNSVDCIWYCATYNGRTNVYVSLDFVNSRSTGFVWIKDGEYISDGICN
ncbi:MAG: hypothetical protein QMC38_11710 [Sinobacterium sp.]|jgi:hypothetical protein